MSKAGKPGFCYASLGGNGHTNVMSLEKYNEVQKIKSRLYRRK